jgi:phosphatidylglycerol lysyltransferase
MTVQAAGEVEARWLWRGLHRATPILFVALLGAAIWLIHRELGAYHYEDVRRSLAAIPRRQLGWALLLTALSYWTLTGYDVLALRYLGCALPYRRVALASFLGYTFAHNLGASVLSGAAARYRVYSSWEVPLQTIAGLIAFCSLTFWLGALVIVGTALLVEPLQIAGFAHLPPEAGGAAGVLCLAAVSVYLLLTFLRRAPLVIAGWEISLPRPWIAIQQTLLSTLDWAVAAVVLYVLLPPSIAVSFWHFLALFVLAQVLGVASHVPGGLGVFDTIMLVSLRTGKSGAALVGALLVYRAIYYLAPLALATAFMTAHELGRRGERLSRVGAVLGEWWPALAPRLLAALVFASGALLLLSGAKPAMERRLSWLGELLPLPVLELSHFLGSLVGLGLLLLANALDRRLDAAFHFTVALLGVGVVTALLKGLDYVEALALIALLVALLPCRHHFYRRTSLVGERFTLGWMVAVVLVVAGSVWLGLFAHKHQEYSRELWWQFSLFDAAPRFLRASVGVVAVALFFAAGRLLRPARHRPEVPDDAALATVRTIVAAAPRAAAHLALLGDKSFLLSDDRRAFIMYAVAGRSCIAMSDPIGPPECHAELVWTFRETCDRTDSWPVFYEAGAELLPLYLDVGLTPFKFGEEARVSLPGFSLDAKGRKEQRYVVRRVEREGGSFEVLPPGAVTGLHDELRAISDAWLAAKRTREKGFSLGRFDAAYLSELPIAVVRQHGTVVAFASLWCSGEHEEIGPDLMRYDSRAPYGVMEYLFLQLIFWGQREGYRWLNIGMAPLSGLASRPLAPLWHRLGAFAYRRGEQLYNFRGVRFFKEKFDPEWRPRYLVCPGGIALPRVLANVAALVSGGLKGVVSK